MIWGKGEVAQLSAYADEGKSARQIGLLMGGSLWIAETLRDRIDDLTDTGGKA